MKIIDIPISLIEENTGQLAGLPANPRKIDRANLNKLVQSIKQDPEMLGFRCLLLYPIGDKYLTIGGNMRLAALKALGYKTCPCVVISKDTPVSKLRNYIIKDNSEFGEWEYSKLLEQWDSLELEEWAVNIPDFAKEEFKEEQKRKGWKSDKEAKESVCEEIAKEIGIVFYKDTITAKTRQRINPKFNLEKDIKENNIIVYDDIITTGSTLVGVHKLLADKNILYIVGINNN